MTTASFNPLVPVVLGMGQDFEDVEDLPVEPHPTDESVVVSLHIEDHAITHGIDRSENLPEFSPVGAIGV